jgi:archaellum component FlaC
MKTAFARKLDLHTGTLEMIRASIEEIHTELGERLDNMSDAQRESEAGEQLEHEVETLQSCLDDLESTVSRLSDLS